MLESICYVLVKSAPQLKSWRFVLETRKFDAAYPIIAWPHGDLLVTPKEIVAVQINGLWWDCQNMRVM